MIRGLGAVCRTQGHADCTPCGACAAVWGLQSCAHCGMLNINAGKSLPKIRGFPLQPEGGVKFMGRVRVMVRGEFVVGTGAPATGLKGGSEIGSSRS